MTKSRIQKLGFAIAIFIFLSGNALLSYFAMIKDVSPEGGGGALLSISIGIFAYSFMLALGGLLAGLVMLFYKSRRETAIHLLIAVAMVFLSGLVVVPLLRHARDVRMEEFRALGHRLTPLVEAIEQYHDDKGVYPEKMNLLVPDYLDELPGTNMANHQEYDYYVGDEAAPYEGNPWVINMSAGLGMNFDLFLYFPLQNYPKRGFGGNLQRLDQWAYVWE